MKAFLEQTLQNCIGHLFTLQHPEAGEGGGGFVKKYNKIKDNERLEKKKKIWVKMVEQNRTEMLTS